MNPQQNTTRRERPRRSSPITAARYARRGSAWLISNKMAKTAVVETVTRVPHAKFRKIIKQSKKFYAHDEENKAQVGDRVRIMETRPLSRLKRWRLVEILQH